MSSIPKLRILVVEDDRKWKNPIVNMYENILGNSGIVDSVDSGPEALKRIEREKYNILSVDINLYLAHPLKPDDSIDHSQRGIDGRTILEEAAEAGTCAGVVVITGLQRDENLHIAIQDEDDRDEVLMTLHEYLNRLFPEKNLYFQKGPEKKLLKCIQLIEKKLSYEKLLKLGSNFNKFRLEGNRWNITYNCKSYSKENSGGIGLQYIHFLIGLPNKDISTIILYYGLRLRYIPVDSSIYDNMSKEQLEEYGLSLASISGAEKVWDLKAIIDIKNSMADIEKQMVDAEGKELEKLKKDYKFMEKELKKTINNPRTNSKDAVYQAIDRSMQLIKKDGPKELWEHLEESINTGYTCNYSPKSPTEWVL